jgi:hypothetical protein
MKSDEGFSDMLDKTILIDCLNENVIRFPDQNTLRTRVKQIRNPRKKISGGFFLILNYLINYFVPVIMLRDGVNN